ncbi:hypothetical protein FBZ93_101406 [Bradyrhizobium macuxiense]|uniref:Uncharacterized protein n=1 Tax=Bradyrhizobium macuxiense TaxID=1755647 RepID=A0A560MIC4_9BRAD|nr:hypothetical protein [Bradyrhizobium macuxiense]TWC07115.1 hypothetical protein FBZ93_101406 [Bradyrhizobium macuxiense]
MRLELNGSGTAPTEWVHLGEIAVSQPSRACPKTVSATVFAAKIHQN